MKFFLPAVLFLTLFLLSAQEIDLRKNTPGSGASARFDGSKLIVDYPKSDPVKKNFWPSVVFELPRDCSRFQAADVTLNLSGGLAGSISVLVRDSKKGRQYTGFPIADGTVATFRFIFNPRKVDLKAMKSLNLYLSRPAFDSQFQIRSIRLVNTTEQKAGPLRKAAKELNAASILKKLDSPSLTADQLTGIEKELRSMQISCLEARSAKSFGAAPCDRLLRLRPCDGLFAVQCKAAVELAKNEAEDCSFLTVSSKPVESIRASVSGFPSGIMAEIHPAGIVNTTKSSVPGAVPGWYFDPILLFTDSVKNLKAGQLQRWELLLKSSPNVKAGSYEGKVHFTAGRETITLPVAVRVCDFVLPDRMALPTATSVYGSRVLGKRKTAMELWITKNYHLNGLSIYSDSGSYNDPVIPSIERCREFLANGGNFLPILYLKLPRQAMHTGKGIPPRRSKELWAKLSPEEQRHYPAEWKEKYIAILSKLVPQLKAAGIWEFCWCYGFDEATASEWPAIAELIQELKSRFPGLRICSTLGDISLGERSCLKGLIDAWIPYVGLYKHDCAERARKRGEKVWYYTTQLLLDGEQPSAIRSQLGEKAFALHINGWLVWTVSRWENNPVPITTSPLTVWKPDSCDDANGGGSYFCMGPGGMFLPTLRAEAIRDGIEDHYYYTMLKERSAKLAKSDSRRKAAEELLKELSSDSRITSASLLSHRRRAAELLEKMPK